MAGKPTLAQAWIGLTPTLDGSAKAIQRELGGIPTGAAGAAAGKSYGAGFAKFAAPLAGAAAGFAAFNFGKDALAAASDLGESLNAVDVVFGESSNAVKALGEVASQSVGLSNVDFNALAVQFSAFAKNISGDGGDVAGTIEEITTRSADMASVLNLEVADAAALFQSGLAGESEPLRRYGIDVSAAAVNAYAYANGIAEAGTQLTEGQKTLSRYGLIMQETDQYAGDFSNTSDSLANQQRILGAEWDNLKAKVGAPLVTALEDALPVISSAIDGISGVIDDLKDPSTAIGAAAAEIERTLTPAVGQASAAFNDDLLPAVERAWGAVKDPLLTLTIAYIYDYVTRVADAFTVIADTMTAIGDGIDWVADTWHDAAGGDLVPADGTGGGGGDWTGGVLMDPPATFDPSGASMLGGASSVGEWVDSDFGRPSGSLGQTIVNIGTVKADTIDEIVRESRTASRNASWSGGRTLVR